MSLDNCDLSLVPPWIWAVQTILHEARNQTLDGMIGVAEVIRDRTNQKFYSDGTIVSTALRDRQFSGWNASDPNRIICGKLQLDHPMVVMAMKAWRMCISNKTELTGGALFYHAKNMPVYPTWSKSPEIVRTTEIGDHIFYKKVS